MNPCSPCAGLCAAIGQLATWLKWRFSPRRLRSRPARAARRHDAGTASQILPDLAHDLDGLGMIQFCIDLSRGWRAVTKDHASCINTELLA